MSNELKVGLAVLVALVALFFGVRFLRGLPVFGSGYEVVVVFDDAQGLTAGNAVRLSGVAVGAVREVALADGGRAVLARLGLDPGVVIPRGSAFSIGGFAALGDVFVEIAPPDAASAGPPLAGGDTLRAEPSGDLLATLTERAGPLALRADTLLASAVNTFRGVEGLVEGSSGDLDATAAQLRFITATTAELLLAERARVGAITAALERAALSAERTTGSAEALVGGLDTEFGARAPALGDSLAATVAGLNARLRQLDASLAGLDRVAVGLDSTLALARSTDGSLGLLLRDPALYHNANAAAASLETLLTDFQNNPVRYLEALRLVDLF